MDKELKHIELIDKYLSGALDETAQKEVEQLIKEDEEFARELALYQLVYKEVESEGEQALKSRLEGYYEEYLSELPAGTRPIWRRRKWLGWSIAASLILAGSVFMITQIESGGPVIQSDGEGTVGVDSTSIRERDSLIQGQKDIKLAEEDITQDSIQAVDDTQFAFTQGTKLAAQAVRHVVYPSTLQYTFFNKELSIFGDPGISGLDLQLIKNGQGVYWLKYKQAIYELSETNTRSEMQRAAVQFEAGSPSQEEISIKIEGLETIAMPAKQLEVYVTGNQSLEAGYIFESTDEGDKITINAGFEPEDLVLYQIEKSSMSSYYLIHEKNIYALEKGSTGFVPLRAATLMTHAETRLFIDKPPFSSTVFQIN